MYDDSLKIENKIITTEDLVEIFNKMQEKLDFYKKIYDSESRQNKILEYKYQKWTFKDTNSGLKFHVEYHDGTNISYDNYYTFIADFNRRLEDIKSIYVRFNLSYEEKEEGFNTEWRSNSIDLWIYEEKINVSVSFKGKDDKIRDVYDFIKEKFLTAKPKYDKIIKNKFTIQTICSLYFGMIPSMVIVALLLLIPYVRELSAKYFILYPLATLFLTYLIGGTIESIKLDKYYSRIKPEKKYAGYDSYKGESIYKDDIEKYVGTSEVLIGKNANNLKSREQITNIYKQAKKILPYEFLALVILTIISIVIGKLI